MSQLNLLLEMDEYGRTLIEGYDHLDQFQGGEQLSHLPFDTNGTCHDNAACGDVGCANGGCL